MNDADRAWELLVAGGHACVLCRGDQTLVSDAPGVAPLVDWLAAGLDLTAFSAADRVVGRAAALLYVAAGVARVHAMVASEPAQDLLGARRIPCRADQTVAAILNRDRTGSCPMEAAVAGVDDPVQAVERLTEALARLRARIAQAQGGDSSDGAQAG